MNAHQAQQLNQDAQEVLQRMKKSLSRYAEKPTAKREWIEERVADLRTLIDFYRLSHKPIVLLESEEEAYRRGYRAARLKYEKQYQRGVDDATRLFRRPNAFEAQYMTPADRERHRHAHNDRQRQLWADHH